MLMSVGDLPLLNRHREVDWWCVCVGEMVDGMQETEGKTVTGIHNK